MPPINVGFTGSRSQYWSLSEAELQALVHDIVALTAVRLTSLDRTVQLHIGDAGGVDQAVLKAGLSIGLPLTIYHPFENPRYQAEYYTREDLVTLFRVNTYATGSNQTGQAYAIRDKYMVDQCHFLVAIWDGSSRGTRLTFEYAKQRRIPVRVYRPRHLSDVGHYQDY